MGLRMLRSGLAMLAPGVAVRSVVTESDRTEAAPWRAWYKTAEWQRLRWRVLVRDAFTCAKCGRIKGKTSQLVADHVVRHRGDAALFWNEANLQCLCKPCHDGAKQSEERRGVVESLGRRGG